MGGNRIIRVWGEQNIWKMMLQSRENTATAKDTSGTLISEQNKEEMISPHFPHLPV